MLKFYLISTVISILVIWITTGSIEARLKREGYKCNTKYSFIEKVQICIYFVIPYLNIAFALIYLFATETIYEGVKEKRVREEQK